MNRNEQRQWAYIALRATAVPPPPTPRELAERISCEPTTTFKLLDEGAIPGIPKSPMLRLDLEQVRKIAFFDKDICFSNFHVRNEGRNSLLDHLTPEQRKALNAWCDSQVPVNGSIDMMKWPDWVKALQQNPISRT